MSMDRGRELGDAIDQGTATVVEHLGPITGRRPVTPTEESRILELRSEGYGILKIGRKLCIGTSVVQRVLK